MARHAGMPFRGMASNYTFEEEQLNLDLAQRGAAYGAISKMNRIFQDLEYVLQFFKNWLKLDIPTLATAIVVSTNLSAGSHGLTRLQTLGFRIYEYFTAFFSSSISIKGGDRLNREVLDWLRANVLEKRNTRTFTAQTMGSDPFQTDSIELNSPQQLEILKKAEESKNVPVVYLPELETTWFIYKRNILTVRRALKSIRPFFEGARSGGEAASGRDELIITCLGRSAKPIKEFLQMCREYALQQNDAYVTVHTSKRSESYYGYVVWDGINLKPVRPLETVHIDEKIKAELVRDLAQYLDPKTRQFYRSRCIPYRRGYLLKGPPGSGKTSLALALASQFGLDLYLLKMPTINGDSHLESLFSALPNRCIVLLEDIDAATGVARQLDVDIESGSLPMQRRFDDPRHESNCTLSGLLNVLDGVDSREGRVVLMTSNAVNQLDKALTRPGRIDRIILLSYIKREGAKQMFMRMFHPDNSQDSSTKQVDESRLEELASNFSSKIPEDNFTPAKVQGYLLSHRDSPEAAIAEVAKWVTEELELVKIAKQQEELERVKLAKQKEEEYEDWIRDSRHYIRERSTSMFKEGTEP